MVEEPEHICADKTNRLSRASWQRPFLSGTTMKEHKGEEKTVPVGRSEIEIAPARSVCLRRRSRDESSFALSIEKTRKTEPTEYR